MRSSVDVHHKKLAQEFLRLAASGKVREAFDGYIAPGFHHHNPFFPGDAKSLAAAMEENAAQNPNKRLDVFRSIEEGDLVTVHSRVRHTTDGPAHAVVHIFRFHGDRIIEMWDVAQEEPRESVNENGMF